MCVGGWGGGYFLKWDINISHIFYLFIWLFWNDFPEFYWHKTAGYRPQQCLDYFYLWYPNCSSSPQYEDTLTANIFTPFHTAWFSPGLDYKGCSAHPLWSRSAFRDLHQDSANMKGNLCKLLKWFGCRCITIFFTHLNMRGPRGRECRELASAHWCVSVCVSACLQLVTHLSFFSVTPTL